METVSILLPLSVKEYVETQVVEGGYDTVSDYLCSLVRDDQKRKAEEKVEALLIEGLDSGPPIEATPEYWEQKRAKLVERIRETERA